MTRETRGTPRGVRAFLAFFSQETARTNAAEASAELRRRRREREEVDAYLAALPVPIATEGT